MKLRRISERVKQALGLGQGGASEWKPTSNARNVEMIKEARKFAQQLKVLHRDLATLDKTVEGGLSTLRSVLNSSLPRAYDETAAGVAPVDKEEHLVGTNVNIEGVASASNEMKQRLQHEVLHPLEQWLAAYRSIKERNKKCEEMRLDLDNKRRSTMALHDKFQRLESKGHKDADSVKFKVQTEEDKLHRLGQRYAEIEAEVFNALLTLIRDTAVLREYAAAALAIMQRCFAQAYTAFDLNAPPPLPALPPPAVPAGYPPLSYTPDSGARTGSLGGSYASPTTRISGGGPTSYSAGGASSYSMKAHSAGGALGGSTSFMSGAVRPPGSPNADLPYGSASTPGAPPSAQPPAYQQATSAAPVSPTRSEKPAAPAATVVAHVAPAAQDPVSLPPPPQQAAAASSSKASKPSSKDLPAPPSWYNEAKANAKAPAYDDSDDEESHEHANPFMATVKPAAATESD